MFVGCVVWKMLKGTNIFFGCMYGRKREIDRKKNQGKKEREPDRNEKWRDFFWEKEMKRDLRRRKMGESGL